MANELKERWETEDGKDNTTKPLAMKPSGENQKMIWWQVRGCASPAAINRDERVVVDVSLGLIKSAVMVIIWPESLCPIN